MDLCTLERERETLYLIWFKKMSVQPAFEALPDILRNAWLIRRACKPICCIPISPCTSFKHRSLPCIPIPQPIINKTPFGKSYFYFSPWSESWDRIYTNEINCSRSAHTIRNWDETMLVEVKQHILWVLNHNMYQFSLCLPSTLYASEISSWDKINKTNS